MKIVLDAGAFMNTNYLPQLSGDIYLCERVEQEVRSQMASSIYDLLVAKHKISMLNPGTWSRQVVSRESAKMGQTGLSEVDVDVLALSLELSQEGEVTLYSDDYAVRNVAHQLGINSRGISTKGGEQKRLYGYQCHACGSTYKVSVSECEVCGHTAFKRLRRS